MFNLPIVQRELLIASRGLGSWLSRWILAMIAVSLGGFWLLAGSSVGQNAPGSLQGDVFFTVMTWSCFTYCLLAGLWTTTDTLTREKNDGTLGLLFLTDLRGYDVVLGKMFSGSLRSFYGVLAVLPVLALPLLMGGVTNTQFLRTVFALLNILIFSLSCGIFFSAICRRTGQSIFYTLLFLVSGFLVMLMAAGFCMLESGMVTSKSVSTIAAKNIGLYSIAGLMFWVIGYNVAYGIPEGGYIGSFTPWSDASAIDTGYSDGSDWFFQMVFCATTVSIVSGTLAERIKIWPFFLFAAILTGIIYPIEMGWQWGGGWLSAAGFSDFAGSTLVHAAGGAAALAGAIVLGPRLGRFSNGKLVPFASSSIPLATLGTFILWFGWFGFNGGSQLALAGFENATAVATIYINTNLAACAGVMTCAVITRLINGKTDVIMMLNGALG